MSAARVLARADELAAFSEEPGRITRPLLTPALAGAMGRVREWMESAGLETRSDALGNLAGRRGDARVLIGSHLDSVRDAGRYDGVLGVLVGIEVAEAVDAPLEVVAFADEEGLRFRGTFLGSRAFVGGLDDELELRDDAGVTLGDALGGPLGPPLYRPVDAYLEVHIEQGPVLEAEGLPLGVVTAIAGQSRFALIFAGEAAHAGTTPAGMRHDALAAAAEFVLAGERAGGTVGLLSVLDGAVNVVPGRVEATLDLRDQDDAARARRVAALRAQAEAIGARRGVRVEWSPIAESPAVPCATERLAASVAATGVPVRELLSGAGHDAMTMAPLTEVAILFVRCKGGISHHPGESVEEADVALAIDAATRFTCSI